MEMMSDSSFKRINETRTIEELYSIKKDYEQKVKEYEQIKDQPSPFGEGTNMVKYKMYQKYLEIINELIAAKGGNGIQDRLFLFNEGSEVEIKLTKSSASGISDGSYWYKFYLAVRNGDTVQIEYCDETLLTSELEELIKDTEFLNLEENVEFKKVGGRRYLCLSFYPSRDWFMLKLSDYNFNLLKEYIEKKLKD